MGFIAYVDIIHMPASEREGEKLNKIIKLQSSYILFAFYLPKVKYRILHVIHNINRKI